MTEGAVMRRAVTVTRTYTQTITERTVVHVADPDDRSAGTLETNAKKFVEACFAVGHNLQWERVSAETQSYPSAKLEAEIEPKPVAEAITEQE